MGGDLSMTEIYLFYSSVLPCWRTKPIFHAFLSHRYLNLNALRFWLTNGSTWCVFIHYNLTFQPVNFVIKVPYSALIYDVYSLTNCYKNRKTRSLTNQWGRVDTGVDLRISAMKKLHFFFLFYFFFFDQLTSPFRNTILLQVRCYHGRLSSDVKDLTFLLFPRWKCLSFLFGNYPFCHFVTTVCHCYLLLPLREEWHRLLH